MNADIVKCQAEVYVQRGTYLRDIMAVYISSDIEGSTSSDFP